MFKRERKKKREFVCVRETKKEREKETVRENERKGVCV